MKSPLPRSIMERLPAASRSSDSADSAERHGAENKENDAVLSKRSSGGISCARTGNDDEDNKEAAQREINFLRQELSVIVEKHSMDKLASRKLGRKYQEQLLTLAEELNDSRRRLEAKEGTLAVLEKQIRGKNVFIDELRGTIESLVRERNDLREATAAAATAAAIASAANDFAPETSNNCPIPPSASSPIRPVATSKPSNPSKTPTRQTMKRSSGIGAGSVCRSVRLALDDENTQVSASAPKKTPPPFRSPSPTSRMTPRSLQRHYLPKNNTNTPIMTAKRDPSEGGIETPLTPSTRSTFLLMEQKKTIESLTRALIAKTEEFDKMEKEFEQFKIVVAQETKGAYFLSPKDLSLVTKGPTNAESVLCDSDEFEMERSVSSNNNAPSPTCTTKVVKRDNNGDDESIISASADQFLNRLDNIGLDLSMDIADLSALIDEAGAASAAAAAAVAIADGEI